MLIIQKEINGFLSRNNSPDTVLFIGPTFLSIIVQLRSTTKEGGGRISKRVGLRIVDMVKGNAIRDILNLYASRTENAREVL